MLKHENEVLIDFLNFKDMKIIQRNDHFNFSLDSVLISNFATINRSTKSIVDLGTGNGVIPMLLSKRTKAKISGVELQKISADLAKRNIKLNNLNMQVDIIESDILDYNKYFSDQSQDLVITNPPFFKLDGNKNQLNDLDQLTIARHELTADLDDIIRVGSRLLKNRGYFCMVHRPDRLGEIFEIMKKYNLEPKRLQFCHSKENKPAKILLIEGIKSAKANLQILAPIISHTDNNEYSEKILKMFKKN